MVHSGQRIRRGRGGSWLGYLPVHAALLLKLTCFPSPPLKIQEFSKAAAVRTAGMSDRGAGGGGGASSDGSDNNTKSSKDANHK